MSSHSQRAHTGVQTCAPGSNGLGVGAGSAAAGQGRGELRHRMCVTVKYSLRGLPAQGVPRGWHSAWPHAACQHTSHVLLHRRQRLQASAMAPRRLLLRLVVRPPPGASASPPAAPRHPPQKLRDHHPHRSPQQRRRQHAPCKCRSGTSLRQASGHGQSAGRREQPPSLAASLPPPPPTCRACGLGSILVLLGHALHLPPGSRRVLRLQLHTCAPPGSRSAGGAAFRRPRARHAAVAARRRSCCPRHHNPAALFRVMPAPSGCTAAAPTSPALRRSV